MKHDHEKLPETKTQRKFNDSCTKSTKVSAHSQSLPDDAEVRPNVEAKF